MSEGVEPAVDWPKLRTTVRTEEARQASQASR